jgi:hypothetical protein
MIDPFVKGDRAHRSNRFDGSRFSICIEFNHTYVRVGTAGSKDDGKALRSTRVLKDEIAVL